MPWELLILVSGDCLGDVAFALLFYFTSVIARMSILKLFKFLETLPDSFWKISRGKP
jgi:hypothetical protein